MRDRLESHRLARGDEALGFWGQGFRGFMGLGFGGFGVLGV